MRIHAVNATHKIALTVMLTCVTAAAQTEAELNARVDRAVERGLEYLAATQRANGAYDRNFGETAAITALAGMAFLAKGHLPGEGQYGENINRSLDYVLTCADAHGYFGAKNDGKMYAHSIATLFLSEASGMVDAARQKKLDAALAKAVKIILDAQAVRKNENNKGGWRYTPTSTDSDMSCSGWALMALRSCRLNGGAVPPKAISDAVEYVKRHHSKDTGSFGYQDPNQYAQTLTGAGMLCLELCGQHNDPATLRAAGYLMKNFRNLPNQERCYYGMYYTAQGLFQLGGDSWKTFSTWMYETFIPLQRNDGSWDKGEESPAYQTALCILAFTVPYRQLPIYQRDETVDEEKPR